jgi:putative CocE/NonD family hydrolase
VPFYLHPEGNLSQEKPSKENEWTTYTYDPRNTVSSNGRCIIPYGPAAEGGFSGMGPRDQIELETLPGHGIPGMLIASRPDVLVFQTQPLSEKVRIAGNIQAILWVSSDSPDTDFFVKLIDLYPPSSDYPTGYALPVSEGILRARYREGWETPKPMEAGKIYQIEISLEPAANLFAVNHRIRIDICSSNFPNFDINRNTGDPDDRGWCIAENTIYHGKNHASCIVLPKYPLDS